MDEGQRHSERWQQRGEGTGKESAKRTTENPSTPGAERGEEGTQGAKRPRGRGESKRIRPPRGDEAQERRQEGISPHKGGRQNTTQGWEGTTPHQSGRENAASRWRGSTRARVGRPHHARVAAPECNITRHPNHYPPSERSGRNGATGECLLDKGESANDSLHLPFGGPE